MKAYVEATIQGYIRIYKMLFEHGVETVLAPVFGQDILKRGEEYMEMIGESMMLFADHPDFLSLYDEYQVRVRFYGDYRKEFNAKYPHLIHSFDKATERTIHHNKHKLLYGAFASDATQTIADLSIEYYKSHNKSPNRDELIHMYYGENLEKADIFIGFERFTAFDYPLLHTGEESLYFTIAPSLYMTGTQLRKILYDHIYLRPIPEPEYDTMAADQMKAMREYYLLRRDETFGVGRIENGIWYAQTNSSSRSK
jgi:adenosine tuberculosinyltransferase